LGSESNGLKEEGYIGKTIYGRGVVQGPIDIKICGELISEKLSPLEIACGFFVACLSPILTPLYLLAAQKSFGKDLHQAAYLR
jgi:hypothetical protein